MILVYIEVVMRCILIFISIALFSCAGLQKHPKSSKLSYGGAFGLGQSRMTLSPHVFVDTPVVTVAQADSFKRALRDSLKYFPLVVDSVIADSLQNGADKEYAAAAKKMEQYRKYLKNLPKYELIYGLITAPFVTLFIIYIATLIIAPSILIQLLILFLIGIVIGLWIWGFLIIAFLPYFFLRSAENRILHAPQNAPSNRRIEYEVRTLFMLRKYLSKRYIRKRIEYIRQLGQTEPYNPWLKKLDYFEQDEFKRSKSKGMNLLRILLGLLLLRLLVDLIFSFI